MSREVDQRVVEMQFDNANFEKNTKKTIGTIDKLMEKLQFKGAEKGFEKLDAAAEDVDFDSMSRSLDRLENKFSSLNIIATTALMNITNKIVDAGEKLVKSLSIDQVTSGWNKYTEKTANVQTIMNATGKSIDEVNGYLNKLMWYSDETSFSFSEMTSALSQMTASGGDIKKMIPMIMGIANATADAGKSGFAFQSTIRNLTQSYSAGYLQLQDWKSLNLMGTATKALKQELIDTAVELGTIKEGDVTIASFETSLSKKWANTKVMEKTFEKYASMMEAAYEMTQKDKSLTTSEALEQLTGQYGELAERSALAAQQAKSFAEAIDSTKDAVSSKWMKTFETIFGNKEEATDTWTELANRLYDIFVPSIDALNDRLSEGLDSGWQQLNDKLGDQASVYDAVLQKVAVSSGAVTEDAIEKAGSFAKALQEGGVNAELLQNGLDSAISTLGTYLAMSDKELDAKNMDREAMQKDYDALKELNEEFRTGKSNLADYAEGMSRLSGREHLMQSLWNIMDAIGKVMTPIKEAFEELFPPADGERIYSVAEGLDKLTKKLIISDETAEKIKKTFKGVFSVLKVGTTVLGKIGTAVKEAFGLALNAAQPVGEVLLNVCAGFGDFLVSMKDVVTGSGSLKDKLGGVKNALKKLLSPLDELGGKLKDTKIAGYISEFLEKGENATGMLGKLYSAGKNVFGTLSVLVQGVAGGGAAILGGLGAAVGTLLGKLGSLGKTIEGVIGMNLPTMDEFKQTLTDMPKNLEASMSEFASGFSKSMAKINGSVDNAFAPVKQFFTALKEGFDSISGTDIYRLLSLVDVGLLALAFNQFGKAITSLKKALELPLTTAINSISGTFGALTKAIKTWQKNESSKVLLNMGGALLMLAGAMYVMSRIDPDRFTAVAAATGVFIVLLSAAAKLLEPTAKKFDKAFDSLKATALNAATLWGVAAALTGFAIAVHAVLKGVSTLMETLQQGNIVDTVAGMTTVMTTMLVAFWGFERAMQAIIVNGKSIRTKTILATATAFVAFAAGLRILAGAVKALADYDDWESIAIGATVLAGLMAAFAGLSAAMKKWGSFSFGNGAGFAAMSLGMIELAAACKIIADIDSDAMFRAFGVIGVFLAEFAWIGSTAKIGLKAGAAFVAIASSVLILAGAMAAIGAIPEENLENGAAMVAGALTILSLFIMGFSGADGKNILNAATAMYTMSGAMLVLAGTIAVYAKLGEQAKTGLLYCAGALVEMGVAVLALSLLKKSALDAAFALNSMAGGMLKFAAACALFAVVPWQSLKTAAAALGTLITILLVAGGIVYVVPQFATALEKLGKAFSSFAGGALKLSIAFGILGLLAPLLGVLSQAIVNAAPDIQAALIALVNTLCQVIIQSAEPLTNALIALIGILCDTLIATAPQIAHACRVVIESVITEVLSMGGDLIQKGIDWFAQIFDDDRPIGMVVNGIVGVGKKIIDAFKGVMGIASPSKVMAENGRYILEGLIQGLQDNSILQRAKNAMLNAATAIRNVFTKFWGIHSPSDQAASDAENILEGAILGLCDEEKREELRKSSYDAASEVKKGAGQALDEATTMVQTKMQGLYQAFKSGNPLSGNAAYTNGLSAAGKALEKAQEENILIPGKNGITKVGNKGKKSTLEQLADKFNETAAPFVQGVGSYIDGTIESFYQKVNDTVEDLTGDTGKTKTKSRGGSTKSTKSVADTVAEEYTKKLKANKYKIDAASKEYELWEADSGDTATLEALIEKKTGSLTEAITLQGERVQIAKEQYDELVKKAGADDDKTKDAYATLLDEQTELAELRHEKQETLFKAIKERYDDEASTASDEYELWSALYEDTATVEEKSNKKIENLNRKLAVQAKTVTAAEEEYTALKAEFGEASLKTQAAYRQWLEEQTDQQKLINEINEAQLDAFDDALALLEKQEKLVTNRQNMLAKIYDDGDLAQREEAYKEAVEKYGADSAEARKAATQGTMSAIISVGTALDNMSFSLKKVTNKQAKYTEAVAKFGKNSEEALDAMAEMQDEQYNFVGFAENLADAFEMDDSGKKMMMQLGYAISRNWKPIQNGFQQVWGKVQQKFPQVAQKLANAFGVATSEGFTETATDIFSAITAAVSGDWGQALTSGIAAVLDFAGSDFGQNILANLAPLLTAMPEAFSQLASGGKTVTIMGKAVTVAASGAGELGTVLGGLVSEGGVLSTIVSTVTSFAASLGPQGLLIGGIIAGVAALVPAIIQNWDKVTEFFGNFGKWLSGLFSNLWNGIKKGAEGVGNFFAKLWDGTKNFVKGAVDTGKNIASGIWNGVKGAASTVWNGVKSVADGAVNCVKSVLGIHSPSTVFAEIGQYMMLGLCEGLNDTSDGVTDGLADMMDQTMTIASAAAQMLARVLEDDADEPVIRPLVDLTDVQNGADWIRGNLWDEPEIGLTAQRSAALATRMTQKAERDKADAARADEPDTDAMSNKDIVDAITTLGSRMDGVADAVRNMRLSIDGKKFVGGILDEVDTQMGKRIATGRR